MRTATLAPLQKARRGAHLFTGSSRRVGPRSALLPFAFALPGPLLGALAGPWFALRRLELGPRQERPRLAQPREHLDPLPHRHRRHLPHQPADLVELLEELLDLRRLHPTADGDASPPAHVDHVGVA